MPAPTATPFVLYLISAQRPRSQVATYPALTVTAARSVDYFPATFVLITAGRKVALTATATIGASGSMHVGHGSPLIADGDITNGTGEVGPEDLDREGVGHLITYGDITMYFPVYDFTGEGHLIAEVTITALLPAVEDYDGEGHLAAEADITDGAGTAGHTGHGPLAAEGDITAPAGTGAHSAHPADLTGNGDITGGGTQPRNAHGRLTAVADITDGAGTAAHALGRAGLVGVGSFTAITGLSHRFGAGHLAALTGIGTIIGRGVRGVVEIYYGWGRLIGTGFIAGHGRRTSDAASDGGLDVEILYSTVRYTAKGITVAPGLGVLLAGTVMAQHSTTKLCYPYDEASTDGLDHIFGVLRRDLYSGEDTQLADVIISGILKLHELSSADITALVDDGGAVVSAGRGTLRF